MKIKTNVRAGRGSVADANSTNSTATSAIPSANNATQSRNRNGQSTPAVYYPIVSRCVGS